MKDDIKDPCKFCTDKPVCRGQCAKASPYINKMRAELKAKLEANKKCPATGGAVTERRKLYGSVLALILSCARAEIKEDFYE